MTNTECTKGRKHRLSILLLINSFKKKKLVAKWFERDTYKYFYSSSQAYSESRYAWKRDRWKDCLPCPNRKSNCQRITRKPIWPKIEVCLQGHALLRSSHWLSGQSRPELLVKDLHLRLRKDLSFLFSFAAVFFFIVFTNYFYNTLRVLFCFSLCSSLSLIGLLGNEKPFDET